MAKDLAALDAMSGRLDKSVYRRGEKPPPERKPRKPIPQGKRPRQKTIKQQLLDAKWAGIREATIFWLNRLDPDGAHCFECGRKARTLDLDHVIPRSKSGHYSVSNSQLLCRECHTRKHRNEPEWTPKESSDE